ncbi:type VI secretion system-associated protein TagO [Budvicia aquatica]|uniref:Uncharacterized protein n=1 Tax=Budvicia aquatica TaxID=82979 RepID=A0A2C6CWM0_9GAMM|nr:type VI secretion system-associated protein TagO [Budvicia aquatica]PHI31059.1 hypothetical protein CRN84_17830 [Budvicia aquatica]VFS51273.1 Uncharacterised protein [Budvicia aquatica]
MKRVIFFVSLLVASVAFAETRTGPTTAEEALKPNLWTILTDKNPLDDGDEITGILSSTDFSSGGVAIKCSGGKTELMLLIKKGIVTGEGSKNVIVRIDSSTAVEQKWNLSPDGHRLFSAEPIEFIKSLQGKKKLTVGYTPDKMDQQTMVFDISEIENITKLVSKACKW